MQRLFTTGLAFLFLLAGVHCPSHASTGAPRVEAGGMVALQHQFPANEEGYSEMTFPLLIAKEPGYNGRTFWAYQFSFIGGDLGYAGLQAVRANEKRVNFSIWRASDWSTDGSGANCGFFNHEGSGVQCWLAYQWKPGVKYALVFKRFLPGNWRLSVRDESTGAIKTVATIRVPSSWGRLNRDTVAFLEDFAQGNEQHPSCASVPQTSAVFSRPLADGGTPAQSTTSYTYGACKDIARTSCSDQQDCLASGNLFGQAHIRLKHQSSGLCIELAAGGDARLEACSGADAQLLDRGDDFRLRAQQATKCLDVGVEGQVQALTCTNSSTQVWLPVSVTRALYNPGSGQCLRTAQENVPGTLLVMGSCTGAPAWTDAE